MILSDRQNDKITEYMKNSDYQINTVVFGPYTKATCQYIYGILSEINVGYYSRNACEIFCPECKSDQVSPEKNGYRCGKCKNFEPVKANSSNKNIIYVSNFQARKLLTYVAALTNSTFDELTKGKYVKPTIDLANKIILPDRPVNVKTKKTKNRSKAESISANKLSLNTKISFKK